MEPNFKYFKIQTFNHISFNQIRLTSGTLPESECLILFPRKLPLLMTEKVEGARLLQ